MCALLLPYTVLVCTSKFISFGFRKITPEWVSGIRSEFSEARCNDCIWRCAGPSAMKRFRVFGNARFLTDPLTAPTNCDCGCNSFQCSGTDTCCVSKSVAGSTKFMSRRDEEGSLDLSHQSAYKCTVMYVCSVLYEYTRHLLLLFRNTYIGTQFIYFK